MPAPVQQRSGARRIRKGLIWAFLALLVAGAAAWVIAKPKGAPKTATAAAHAEPPPVVSVVVPGVGAVAAQVQLTGSIAARRASPIGVSGEGGLVSAVLVKEGDFVRRGQVLARIDRSVQTQQMAQMQASIRQAVADAALAQANLNRAQALVSRGFISKADIDQKTATRDGANAKVSLARAQAAEMGARLARLDVRAPTDGLILSRSVEAGQVVGPGSAALFTMAEDGAMELRGRAAEQDLLKVRAGMPVTVKLVGTDRTFPGRVWLVDPTVDPQTRQGSVRVALGRSADLRPGSFANASIAAGSEVRPLLPQSAVQADEKGNFVLIVDSDDRVQQRRVTTGEVGDNGVVIRSGLTGRERVVSSAAAFLNPGEKIAPVIRSATAG